MKKYKIAAVLMIIHGGIMELGGCLAFLMTFLFKTENVEINQYFSFIVPFFQQNLELMMIMGGIYGVVRVIGAVNLWRNKMHGLALSVINCVITMILMMFMLPAGIMDGLLACSALILILFGYFGKKEIEK